MVAVRRMGAMSGASAADCGMRERRYAAAAGRPRERASTRFLTTLLCYINAPSLASGLAVRSVMTHHPAQASSPLPSRSPPSEMSLFDTFKGSVERLTDMRVARASHILLKGFDAETVAKMETFKAEINDDPVRFQAFAKEHSLCPSRAKGGDLGFFTRGKMVKEFDTVVFTSEPGAVYGPVRSDFGHHLIFVHSCRTPNGA